MSSAERSVLHVLPHPGGGGETYVDLLEAMPGYRIRRSYLAAGPQPTVRELSRGVSSTARKARAADLVHVQGEPASGLCLPLLVARPSVVTLNGLHLVRRVTGVRRAAATMNLRALLRAAGRTICVSRAEHEYLAAAVGSRAAERAIVIRNGTHAARSSTPLERSETRSGLGLAPDEPVGIWIGSLDQRKDPLTAMRAAEQAGVGLVVVGDGPLRAEAEVRAGMGIRVVGQRDDLPTLLAAVDFYVLTSRREGLAFALLEAMAAGLPALVWDVPENVEAVGDGGVAVPAGDFDGLVAGFERLAEKRAEREVLGERARHRIARVFSADEMRRRTRAVYDELLSDDGVTNVPASR